jgi:hypothetical protein
VTHPSLSQSAGARNTILSPALISPDTVHNRKATLSGSMCRTLQNVSHRQLTAVDAKRYLVAIRCLHPRAGVGSRAHMRGLWGPALPQATQESCLTKVKCRIRLRGYGGRHTDRQACRAVKHPLRQANAVMDRHPDCSSGSSGTMSVFNRTRDGLAGLLRPMSAGHGFPRALIAGRSREAASCRHWC